MSVRFAGYAAVFDRVDRGGDVVRRGAFGAPGAVPLLWQHGGAPVGVIESVAEDARGLRVIGRIDDARLAGLVSARSGGQPLIEVLAAYLLLHGNAYVQVLATPGGEAAELFALRPERVSVEADAAGWPAAYRYRVGERVTRLVADGPRPEVIHLKAFNPVDDHYGLGCLGAAADAHARAELGLDASSRVLVFGSEGATDPVLFETIVGMPAEAVTAAAVKRAA